MTGRSDEIRVDGAIDGTRPVAGGASRRSNGESGRHHRNGVSGRVEHSGGTAGQIGSSEGTLPADRTQCGLLVAIPAYNEGETIEAVVEGANEYADQVVVIDDGSDDETAPLARSCGATVIEHRRNHGYGGALKTAFETATRAGAESLVLLDGDGQHDPADIPRLVETLETAPAEFVIGSRFLEPTDRTIPRTRRFGLHLINTLTNVSLGVVRKDSRVTDTQSGYRAFGQEMIASLATDPSIGDRMDASTDVLYHAHHHDYTIEEIPVTMSYAVANANTMPPVRHAGVLIRNILKTIERERPLSALGVPGIVLSVSGMTTGYWTIQNYIESGTFPFGHGLLTAIFLVLGVFACFTGIVLHALSTYFPTESTPRRIR